MRNATIFILAAALAAVPAAAQNEANAAAVNTETANNVVMANETNAMAPGMNYVGVEPPEEVTPPATTRVVKDKRPPWGLIGLVGLIGLLGRRRRSD